MHRDLVPNRRSEPAIGEAGGRGSLGGLFTRRERPGSGTSGNPATSDHDDWGFRNPERPSKPWVVALGDSQTYGTNVTREKAWPAVVERHTGKPVYNMAVAGYGPAHSLLDLLSLA